MVYSNIGLIDQMKRSLERSKNAAETAIEGIARLADELDMEETAKHLRSTQDNLHSDTYSIIVMGRFKNGKSTLLNALMGGTTHPVNLGEHKGPMVVDDLPATAVLTGVRYAQEPYVKAIGHDGDETDWGLDRYLNESVLDIDEVASQQRFGGIREFVMGFPARLCEAGVTIYDSPGLDDQPIRDMITREATKRCDAAVVVFRSDSLMGHSDLSEVKNLVADDVKVFTIVNLWNGRAADERLRGYVWNKYVREHLGRSDGWADQDLSAHDVFFIDAERARNAQYDADEEGMITSGLAAFERRMGIFLAQERQSEHLGRFVTQATNLAATIEQYISQRRHAFTVDRKALKEKVERLQPQLESLRERPSRIPVLFDRCYREVDGPLVDSFAGAIARARNDLPMHLADVDLPSGNNIITAGFKQKQQLQEASTAISEFVTQRIQEWSTVTAPSLLRPSLEHLYGAIEQEISAIGRQVEEIHLELTGWRSEAHGTSVVGPAERVLSAVASVLVGNALGALTGGATGWRGAAGAAAGAVGAGLVLGALGVSAAVVLWPVALTAVLLGGLLGGHIGLGNRVKAAALAEAEKNLERLAADMQPVIREKLRLLFEERRMAVTAEVRKLVAAEEENINNIVRATQQEEANRDLSLAVMNEAGLRLQTLRRELSDARSAAILAG